MNLPFSISQFLDVFQHYNTAVFPFQWVLLSLAAFAVIASVNGGDRGARAASGVLALCWLWMGVVYHWLFFRSINPAASIFAVAFIAEGVLIVWMGVARSQLVFEPRGDTAGVFGAAFIAYAFFVYPAIGYLLGHRYPFVPTFGVPCPTTIFTFGMLLLTKPPRSRVLIIVPVAWAVLGAVAAIQLGMWEDIGLVIAAIVATVIVFGQRTSSQRSSKSHPTLTTAAT